MRVAVLLAVPLALLALAGPASAQSAPKAGDAVWAEWQPNDWYRAKITKKTSKGFQVLYEDGVEGEVSASKVALDVAPDKGQVKDGVRVLAKWTDGKFYPGKAGAAKADGSYAVTFDDGDKANVKLKDLRLLAVAGAARPAEAPVVASPTCGTVDSKPERGFGLVGSKWIWTDLPVENGRQVLRVRFLNGDAALHKKVEAAVKPWTDCAAITFKFGNDANAEIRINFTDKNHSDSAIGTSALHQDYKGKPTMNLGMTNASTGEQISRVVLHEFGHALGFQHEHLHPHANIPWDKAAVIAHYTEVFKATMTAKEAEAWVLHNIFEPVKVPETNFAEFDSKSIMLYPVPEALTKGDFKIDWNNFLSAADKDLAAKWYPPVAAKPTPKPTEPKEEPTCVIHVKITNESKSAVDVITMGTSTSKPQSLAPNASATYSFEIDAVKGGGVEIKGPKGGP